MSDESSTGVFPLAKMCALIWMLTLGLLGLPVLFFATVVFAGSPLAIPGVFIVGVYAWIWLRMRPTRFAVSPDALEVTWRREVGFGMRVGAGGLWGGFGWLWSRRRGIVQMYVSRIDGFVWIETVGGRPWLVTPAEPERFVRALSTSR